jgi:Survival motor neuron (SMN) interacting protein 1 (SIP1)
MMRPTPPPFAESLHARAEDDDGDGVYDGDDAETGSFGSWRSGGDDGDGSDSSYTQVCARAYSFSPPHPRKPGRLSLSLSRSVKPPALLQPARFRLFADLTPGTTLLFTPFPFSARARADPPQKQQPTQPRALPVSPTMQAAAAGPPTSAAAYLARVRAEAARLPSVLVAAPTPAAAVAASGRAPPEPPSRPYVLLRSSATEVAQPAAHAAPRRKWADAVLSMARRQQARLGAHGAASEQPSLEPSAWWSACWDTASAQKPPDGRIAALDHIRVISLLDLFDAWIDDDDDDPCAVLADPRYYWLFGILCALQEYVVRFARSATEAWSFRRQLHVRNSFQSRSRLPFDCIPNRFARS